MEFCPLSQFYIFTGHADNIGGQSSELRNTLMVFESPSGISQ